MCSRFDSGSMTNSFSITNDHLGSWTTIVNEAGLVEREQSFDAWGNMRAPETWSGNYNSIPMFDRGFTGHEHLYGFGLINMNGRMYDPVMSGFLSPDNYIQSPDFSQSFNRYAYCLNNPLKYVDPSGEFFTWSINQHGFSIGLNFTPAGIPLGFGVNVGWADGGSVGLYGEAAYRVGGTGLGAGAGVQQSMDFNFNSGWSTSSSVFAYASYACFTAGGSAGYNWTSGSPFWGVNAGIGFSNSAGNLGGGLSVGYGSGGWTFGANGYYNRMQKATTTIVSTATVDGTIIDGERIPGVAQLGDHDCLESVYQYIAETYGMELTPELKGMISECIVSDGKGNYFLRSGNKFMDIISTGHSPYNEYNIPTLDVLYSEIKNHSRIAVNLAPMKDRIGMYYKTIISDGHSVAIQSISKTISTDIWGRASSGYAVTVMNPTYGKCVSISPNRIVGASNISVFFIGHR